jgi:hypothetical protein
MIFFGPPLLDGCWEFDHWLGHIMEHTVGICNHLCRTWKERVHPKTIKQPGGFGPAHSQVMVVRRRIERNLEAPSKIFYGKPNRNPFFGDMLLLYGCIDYQQMVRLFSSCCMPSQIMSLFAHQRTARLSATGYMKNPPPLLQGNLRGVDDNTVRLGKLLAVSMGLSFRRYPYKTNNSVYINSIYIYIYTI